MLFTIIGICPSCHQKGKSVEQEILFYHIDDISKIVQDNYFFCGSEACKIVYFSSKVHFEYHELNKEVGIKSYSSQDAHLCYCFNIKKKDIDGQTIKSVQSKMASFGCKCTIRNPQGVCCQKDIKHSLTAQKNMLSFTSNTPLN